MFDFLYSGLEKVFFFYNSDATPNSTRIAFINFDKDKEDDMTDEFTHFEVPDPSELKQMIDHFKNRREERSMIPNPTLFRYDGEDCIAFSGKFTKKDKNKKKIEWQNAYLYSV